MSETPCLLLTGATGFVGGHLGPRLSEMFPHYRKVMTVHERLGEAEPAWERAPLDLTDTPAVDALIERLRPAITVHLAGQPSVGEAGRRANGTWRANTFATFGLAEAIAKSAPRSLVFFTSSAEVYGSSLLNGPAQETTPTGPVNSYAVSKLASERILEDVLSPENRLITVRSFNHSGPGQDERFALPSFAAQIARAEAGLGPASISVGNLSAARDFLHVTDVVEAYLKLIAMAEDLPMRSVFNVASGKAARLDDLLDKLLSMARRPIEVVVDPSRLRPAEIPAVVGDASKLNKITGWAPRLTTDDLIYDLLSWSRSNLGETLKLTG